MSTEHGSPGGDGSVRHADKAQSYDVMASEACDPRWPTPGLDYTAVQRPTSGYVYATPPAGSTPSTRRLTGIPVLNVNNNCATGSSALWLARQAVESGAADCVLALASSRCAAVPRLPLGRRPQPARTFRRGDGQLQPPSDAPMAAKYFGGAGPNVQGEVRPGR